MHIQVIEQTSDSIQFLVIGSHTAFTNALRRVMIADVPTWAIELVQFENNTTIIPDEMIAHRLALIPLTSSEEPDEESLVYRDNVPFVKFTLDLQAGEDNEEWTSEYLEAESEQVLPAIDGIPIAKVARGQELKLTALAKKGTGAEHSKWSPVHTCSAPPPKEGTADGILFTIDTKGSLDPVEVVQRAIEIFREQLETATSKMQVV